MSPESRRRFRALCAREESGQATVEFALVIPIMVLVLLAILQFGLLFLNYIDLTSAARDGARKLSVSRASATGVADAKTAIQNSTSVVDDADVTVTVTPGQPWNTGQDVEVKLSYPYSLNILGIAVWDGPMKAESKVRVE